MKKRPNYGFPLSHMLFRFFLFIVVILILIVIIIIYNFVLFTFLLSALIIFIYIYFVIIRYKNSFLKNRQQLLKNFIKISNIKGNEMILDLGSGSGFLAIGFAKFLKSGKSFGVDKFSFKNDNLKTQIINLIKINFFGNTLKNAKINAKLENVENLCEFIKTDITKSFDLPNNFFDIVVSSQFFYCISYNKRIEIYKEIDKVLKKNGKIIFFESKSFMNWNINEIKNFFENIGYRITLIPDKNFRKCYILVGQKNL